ncbi:hypothetical protein IG631_19781 [Alternaria alternata]|nr:hypothetical protein IG631_19781 [Alternaria alternata]
MRHTLLWWDKMVMKGYLAHIKDHLKDGRTLIREHARRPDFAFANLSCHSWFRGAVCFCGNLHCVPVEHQCTPQTSCKFAKLGVFETVPASFGEYALRALRVGLVCLKWAPLRRSWGSSTLKFRIQNCSALGGEASVSEMVS